VGQQRVYLFSGLNVQCKNNLGQHGAQELAAALGKLKDLQTLKFVSGIAATYKCQKTSTMYV
jgi:hypothetical protein